jgi:uncharacterized membrane protein YhiD involved in acid resistance
MINELDKLKDIKPLVEVSTTFYDVAILIVTICLIVLFFKLRRKRKKLSQKEKAKLKLQNLDYNDTKNCVYDFCEYAKYFLNEKNNEEFKKIEKELLRYKYKKEVPSLDKDTINKIKNFIKSLK